MSKTRGMKLLRYDYTESCKGEDLCDRESAVVNTVINSFVSLGKDLLSANDMFTAVHYGKGLKKYRSMCTRNVRQHTYTRHQCISFGSF